MLMSGSKHRTLLVVIFGLLLVSGVVAYVAQAPTEESALPPAPPEQEQVVSIPDDWYVTATLAAQFRHPEKIGGEYHTATTWPPTVRISDEPFSCSEGGDLATSGGKTERRMIGGHEYCVTELHEGAAGSVFIDYAYAFAHGEKTAVMSFGVSFPRCENFDASEQAACSAEQAAFEPDVVVDRMAESLVLR